MNNLDYKQITYTVFEIYKAKSKQEIIKLADINYVGTEHPFGDKSNIQVGVTIFYEDKTRKHITVSLAVYDDNITLKWWEFWKKFIAIPAYNEEYLIEI